MRLGDNIDNRIQICYHIQVVFIQFQKNWLLDKNDKLQVLVSYNCSIKFHTFSVAPSMMSENS